MKMIRMAVLVAAATAAASKAKDYARENPEQASRTLERAQAFVAGKAGPKYADKVGKGGAALRSGLGLPAAAEPSDGPPPASPAPAAGTGFDPAI
jgi:hypothetical protein